jgi:ABC-type polysaccharide/polyol phosphate export permease
MLPQFFLAGVFNPINNLPPFLDIPSHLAPMRYAIDLLRDVYDGSHPDAEQIPTNRNAPAQISAAGATGAWWSVRWR